MPEIDPIKLPFTESVEYFAEKTNLDTDSFRDALGIGNDSVFTVAAAKGELLQDIRDAVSKSQSEGQSTQDFIKQFDRIADRYSPDWIGKGNRAWRSQLIYEQNIRTAHARGREEQMNDPVVMKLRPYHQWRHGDSREPRPVHLAMDGLVFNAGEVPLRCPAGFNCRCQIFSLTRRDLIRRGLSVSTLKLGDEIDGVEIIADPGFGRTKQQVRVDTLDRFDPTIRKQVESELGAEFRLAPNSTKVVNGKAYTLQNSRWHLMIDDREIREAKIDELTLDFAREVSQLPASALASQKREIGDRYIQSLMDLSDRDEAEYRAHAIKLGSAVPRELLGSITKDSADFFQLIGRDLPIKEIAVEGDRSYAMRSASLVSLSEGSSARYRRECLFHEAAHFGEYADEDLAYANYEWTRRRASGSAIPLKELCPRHGYDDDEIAFPDKFIDPYVGKLNLDSNTTEVLSMGLENFSDGRKLVEFALKDPDHFRRTVAYIKK